MNDKTLQIIQEMPKAILHIHLDGSLRPETVYQWLKEQGKETTFDKVKENLTVDKDCRNLNQYLSKFNLPLNLLQTTHHLEQTAYELFEDLTNQNVIYAEVRFAPSLHTKQGLSYTQIVEAVIEGMNKAKQKYKIQGNLILCCMRGQNNEQENLETINIAKKYLGNGVCGIDLAGAEAIYPTKDFEYIFTEAKKLNIPYTIHAGETDGKNSIRNALEFGAQRIGHGVRCLESDKLITELINKNISLEVCPISNLQTKATAEPHPIGLLFEKGINITVNTDNNTVSNTNIIEEYKYILTNTNLKLKNIIQMNINAINAAFITRDEKIKLLDILKNYTIFE